MKKSSKLKSLLKGMIFLTMTGIIFASCDKKEVNPTPTGNAEPIVLECDYFNQDRVLTNNPNAPVDYIIDCVMSIKNAKITIEPGVVIEFGQNAGIVLDDFNNNNCALIAKGTESEMVEFRGKEKTRGYWKGIYIASNNPLNELNMVHIQHAGGQAFNSNNDKGAIVLYAGGRVKIADSRFTNNDNYAINSNYSDATLELTNTEFTNNKASIFSDISLINAYNGSNFYSGNDLDYISLHTYTAAIKNAKWHQVNSKYRIIPESQYVTSVAGALTIEPGVEIELPSNHSWLIEGDGSIVANGTAQQPIIFTGIEKVSKSWKGIKFYSKSASNQITHAEFQYSGMGAPEGNIHLWYDAALKIDNVAFKNSNGCGINYALSNGQTENPNLVMGSNITSDSGCTHAEWE